MSTGQLFDSTPTLPINNRSNIETMSKTLPVTACRLGCSPPAIILIPSTSSLTLPLQYRRNQDFFLSSRIDLNCNSSLLITTQWSITNCTSICSTPIVTDPTIIKSFAEIYIPSRTLAYGTYQLKLTVTMASATTMTSTMSAYVKITPSGITANLVPYGTSMITRGHQQDLTLDPGTYSVDLDGNVFNASVSDKVFPRDECSSCLTVDRTGSMSTIVESTVCRTFRTAMACCCPSMIREWIPSTLRAYPIHRVRHTPFSLMHSLQRAPSFIGSGTAPWRYASQTVSPKSAVTILSQSLAFNRTYQWMVYMENRRNATVQATGYVLVRVDDTRPQLVAVA